METDSISDSYVNYDEAPVLELELSGTIYRLDAGRGSVLAVSRRKPGSWDWSLWTEARWDGSRLRSKAFDFEVGNALGRAVAELMRGGD